MSFYKMMQILQEKNKDKIILVNMGNFYVAVDENARALNQMINLKLTCFGKKICKVGFPISTLEKYSKMIENSGYSYAVYFFDKEHNTLKCIQEFEGIKMDINQFKTMNCEICKQNNGFEKQDKYLNAINKFYKDSI